MNIRDLRREDNLLMQPYTIKNHIII